MTMESYSISCYRRQMIGVEGNKVAIFDSEYAEELETMVKEHCWGFYSKCFKSLHRRHGTLTFCGQEEVAPETLLSHVHSMIDTVYENQNFTVSDFFASK